MPGQPPPARSDAAAVSGGAQRGLDIRRGLHAAVSGGAQPGQGTTTAVHGRDRRGPGAAAAVDARLKARGRAADRVGARIREQRLAAGWTQAELGLAIGRSRSAIAAYETGRRVVSHPVLWAIACVLEIGVEVLFQGGDVQRK